MRDGAGRFVSLLEQVAPDLAKGNSWKEPYSAAYTGQAVPLTPVLTTSVYESPKVTKFFMRPRTNPDTGTTAYNNEYVQSKKDILAYICASIARV